MFRNLFEGKRVLISGHTGFKGSWLSLWLDSLGAQVCGMSDKIPTFPSNYDALALTESLQEFRLDIRDFEAVSNAVNAIKPDFIFHLAAQSLVPRSFDYPMEAITTNAIGTANILEAVRLSNIPVTLVMITSDKVYENHEWVWGYRETDRIGGKDPYSASKGMAELVIKTYLSSFFGDAQNSGVKIGVARAGNVIGGGDWAANRLIPDCVRAWSKKDPVILRNPFSTRPWQHVLEPLGGYLKLAAHLHLINPSESQVYNFGPRADQLYSVIDVVTEMARHWSNVNWKISSDMSSSLAEANLLKLNCDRALSELNWMPILEFDETIEMTVDWYSVFYERSGVSMREYSLDQINRYTSIANQKKIDWAHEKGN